MVFGLATLLKYPHHHVTALGGVPERQWATAYSSTSSCQIELG
jgi:hypothetical protein